MSVVCGVGCAAKFFAIGARTNSHGAQHTAGNSQPEVGSGRPVGQSASGGRPINGDWLRLAATDRSIAGDLSATSSNGN